MRSLFRHKVVIGLSAVLLVVTVGAVAWAAPGGDDVGGPGRMGPPAFGVGDDGAVFWGWGHGRRGVAGDLPEEFRERMEERRAAREQRRDAFLDLVREKMSAEDQAALDELTATAEQQRDALEQAREALFETQRQIHDLVDEYFPLGPPPGGGATEESAQ